jgi:hypothetical protein
VRQSHYRVVSTEVEGSCIHVRLTERAPEESILDDFGEYMSSHTPQQIESLIKALNFIADYHPDLWPSVSREELDADSKKIKEAIDAEYKKIDESVIGDGYAQQVERNRRRFEYHRREIDRICAQEETVNEKSKTPGQRAYDAYCKVVDYKNYQGLPVPTWENLSDKIREAWEAAGESATNRPPIPNRAWFEKFDERQQQEIRFSRLYAREYHHGANGHNDMMIIAKMAELLDASE